MLSREVSPSSVQFTMLVAMIYTQGTIDEAKRLFAYDETAITDENGNVTQLEYDPLNRVVKITEADPDGAGSLLSPVTTYIYDADGNVTSTTDAVGNVSQNVYDKLDRLVQNVDALNQKTDYSYDAIGNLLTVVDSLSHKTENKYDRRNRIIQTIALDQGVTKYDYDLSNNLIAVTDQVGNKTSFGYDARNRKTSETDALGKTTQYQFDAANNLAGQVDRNGNRTQYKYDDLNRQIQMQDALGRISSYVYDKANNLTSQTDPLNRVMQYSYDNRDRQKTVTDPLGGVMSYTYDDFSNITAVSDELNRTTTYGYDALNRRIAVTDPLSQTARMVYDGVDNLLSMTDAVGQVTRYDYDKLNRRVKMTDGKGEISTTEYDAEDNIVSMIDPVGNKTTYAYDVNDRRIGETNATGKAIVYQYDLAGNQLGVIDQNGRTRRFAYDKLNRQVSEKWLDASNATVNDVNYTYDSVGNLLAASDANSKYAYTYDAVYNLTSVDNKDTAGVPNVVLASSYDAADNLLKVIDTISGVLKGDTSYTYDALNRATQVTQSGSGVSTKRVDMVYNAASQMTGMSRFSDLAGLSAIVSSLYTYDGKGRLTGLNYKRGGNNIADYAFNFDAIDRITQTTSVDGTSNYTYDRTNQLATADHSFQRDEAYTVDGNGNRTNAGYSTGVNNRLTSDGVFNYEYDANGNRTKRTEIANGNVTEYVWNHRDRLTKVTSKDAAGIETKTAEYTYDVNNRRIAKSVDADGSGTTAATIERYVYDGQNIVLSFDGSGTQTHRYLHGTGVDQVLADENAQGQTLWTLADHQGSIRDVLDNTGVLQNHIVYDSFGKITSQTNASVTSIYAYTGREYDSETGLYFYRARYYDPSTGGFISEDPIGFEAGDNNLYRYVGNSPTNFNDPSGLILDTILDVGFIAYDLYKIAKDNIFGNCDNLGENLLALGADAAGALIPFATGGGAAVRAGKAANQALDAAKAAERAAEATRNIDRAADASKGLDRAGDAAKSSNVADTQKALNPTNCFIAGTEIITRDGTKNIEDIQVGDWVLADDPNTVGEIEYKQVLQTFARSATAMIDLYIDGEKITTTEEHPFWVPEVGWVAAKDLNVGTYLQTKTESWLDIDKIESHTSSTNVYNFEVEGFHTYFVSELGLLVHNECLKPDPKAEGPHTVFKRDNETNKIRGYEEFIPQTNPRDPKPWQSVKRVDLEGAAHHNKITGENVPTPHVNSKNIPGGVRPALPGEIPSN